MPASYSVNKHFLLHDKRKINEKKPRLKLSILAKNASTHYYLIFLNNSLEIQSKPYQYHPGIALLLTQ